MKNLLFILFYIKEPWGWGGYGLRYYKTQLSITFLIKVFNAMFAKFYSQRNSGKNILLFFQISNM